MTTDPVAFAGPGCEWFKNQPAWQPTHALAESVWGVARTRYLGEELQRFESAMRWAAQLHHKQQRAGSTYLEHVFSVAARVLRWAPTGPLELSIAALLHDSVEDQATEVAARSQAFQDTPLRERAFGAIGEHFGTRVRQLVEQLTNPEFEAMIRSRGIDPEQPDGTRLKNELYLKHFDEVFSSNEHAALIKLADFSDNALRLDRLAEQPEQRSRKAEKYRPCVVILRERVRSAGEGSVFFSIREEVLRAIETAWRRDYAP